MCCLEVHLDFGVLVGNSPGLTNTFRYRQPRSHQPCSSHEVPKFLRENDQTLAQHFGENGNRRKHLF